MFVDWFDYDQLIISEFGRWFNGTGYVRSVNRKEIHNLFYGSYFRLHELNLYGLFWILASFEIDFQICFFFSPSTERIFHKITIMGYVFFVFSCLGTFGSITFYEFANMMILLGTECMNLVTRGLIQMNFFVVGVKNCVYIVIVCLVTPLVFFSVLFKTHNVIIIGCYWNFHSFF